MCGMLMWLDSLHVWLIYFKWRYGAVTSAAATTAATVAHIMYIIRITKMCLVTIAYNNNATCELGYLVLRSPLNLIFMWKLNFSVISPDRPIVFKLRFHCIIHVLGVIDRRYEINENIINVTYTVVYR